MSRDSVNVGAVAASDPTVLLVRPNAASAAADDDSWRQRQSPTNSFARALLVEIFLSLCSNLVLLVSKVRFDLETIDKLRAVLQCIRDAGPNVVQAWYIV